MSSTLVPPAAYFYETAIATGGYDDDLCRTCERAFNKGQVMIRATFTPYPPGVAAPDPLDVDSRHEWCWHRVQIDDDGFRERPDEQYADCGHPVMPRGTRPGLTTRPHRRGTLCDVCADDIERLHLADLTVLSHHATRNGDAILTAQGGKLATVTTLGPVGRADDNARLLWITGLTGRIWTAEVPDPRYLGPVTLDAHAGPIPPHVPLPPLNHLTVYPDDRVVVAWNDYAVTVLDTSPEQVTVRYGGSVNGITDTLPWEQIRRHPDRPCCIGPAHLCRCINRAPECPMPGCNARATAWIDRVERHGFTADTYPERVCEGHYDRLVARRGWSAHTGPHPTLTLWRTALRSIG